MSGRRLRRRLVLLATALATGGIALGLALATPALLRVVSPSEGTVIGGGGVEVVISFPAEERVAAETLRVLLNGADMSSEFTLASNGAYARLYELLDGENVLRFEVFGRRWWLPGLLVEEAREVRFLVRLPQHLDRA